MPDDKNLETKSITGLEVFSVGVWNGDSYSEKDLDAMVEAFDKVGFQPPIKAGHAEGQEDEKKARMTFGAPALGYVSRLYRSGKRLLADIIQIPKRFADLIQAGAYKRISSEIYWNFSDEATGNKYPRVLKAIAFLGAEIPALTNLKAIESLYSRNAAGLLFAYDEKGQEYRAYMGPEMIGSHGPKKEKQPVNYRMAEGESAPRCSTCKFYQYGHCALVEGEIEPHYLCDLYEPKTYEKDMWPAVKEYLEKIMSYLKHKDDDEEKIYTIEKRGDKWCLIASDGKSLGCHPTREEAVEQEKAVKANMSKTEPHKEDDMDQKELEKKIADEKAKVEAEFKAKEEALQAKVKEYEAKIAEAEKKAKENSDTEKKELQARLEKMESERKAERFEAWYDSTLRAGKIAPVEKARVKAIHDALPDGAMIVSYAKDDKTEVKEPLWETVKSFIEGRPSLFKTLSRVTQESDSASYDRNSANEIQEEVDRQIKGYMEKHPDVKEYSQAMRVVFKDNPELAEDYNSLPRQ